MNKKDRCPYCHHIISDRKIALFSGMVLSLHRVYVWAIKNNREEFTRKEIKHLFKTDNEIARFCDWVLFGSMITRPQGKGTYKIDIRKVSEFFAGRLKIPLVLWKNPVTRKLSVESYGSINEVPSLREFLDQNQLFVPKYQSINTGQLSFIHAL